MISPKWVLTTQDGRSALGTLQTEETPLVTPPVIEEHLEATEPEEHPVEDAEVPVEPEEPSAEVPVEPEEPMAEVEEAQVEPEESSAEVPVEPEEPMAEVEEAQVEPEEPSIEVPVDDEEAAEEVHAESNEPPLEHVHTAHRMALQKANQQRKAAYDTWRNSLRSELNTMQQNVTELLDRYQTSRTNK